MSKKISVVIPAKNEAASLEKLLPRIRAALPDAEIIVVDDGSDDGTSQTALDAGATVVRHEYSIGNGGAIKSGARKASGDILVFLDADGQHPPKHLTDLLGMYEKGYDMVIGARFTASQSTIWRGIANRFYNWLATAITGHKVLDLTSGFRVVDARLFKQFLFLLPNGFSYPTTITMAFFRAGYQVAYFPFKAEQREGKSHIKPLKDGLRFLIIIFRIGTLYSPLKMFIPISAAFFVTGVGYYLYTYMTAGRFTNMSAMLLTSSVLVFLMGLLSEQVTSLLYTLQQPSSKR